MRRDRSRSTSLAERKQNRRQATKRPLWLETLEDRTLPSVFHIANGDIAGLVAAINTSNTDGHNDTIILAPSGIYDLTAADNPSDGGNGLPVIQPDGGHSLTVEGQGATIERDSSFSTPVFRFFDVTAGANLILNGLTLTNGTASVPNGPGQGGAIYSFGNVTLQSVNLTNNGAGGTYGASGTPGSPNGGNGTDGQGGGIYAGGGSLTLTGSTVLQYNFAGGFPGGNGFPTRAFTGTVAGGNGGNGGNGMGGGIYATGTALTINGATITGNTAEGGHAGFGGAGVHAPAGQTGTSGSGYGAGIFAIGGSVTILNSAISNNIARGQFGEGGNGAFYWPVSADGGAGGGAFGAGFYGVNDSIRIVGTAVSGNVDYGAPGGTGGPGYTGVPPGTSSSTGPLPFGKGGNGGAGGSAQGGGLYAAGSTLSLVRDSFSTNKLLPGGGGRARLGFPGPFTRVLPSYQGNGGPGGQGQGGGIYLNASSLTLQSTTFTTNTVQGGLAGGGHSDGLAGLGQGGGLYATASDLTLAHALFQNNSVVGGMGTPGGAGQGGGVFASDGALALTDAVFMNNSALGGAGFYGGSQYLPNEPAGNGGDGQGGALFADSEVVDIAHSQFTSDAATGGAGGFGYVGVSAQYAGSAPPNARTLADGGAGANGGNGQGGALYVGTGSLVLKTSSISSDTATGGAGAAGGYGGTWAADFGQPSQKDFGADGGTGGSGGAAQGGGIFVGTGNLSLFVTTISQALITAGMGAQGGGGGAGDSATSHSAHAGPGGNGGAGGNAGAAQGGGIYLGQGNLTLMRTTVTQNTAVANAAGSGGGPGGGNPPGVTGASGATQPSIGGGIYIYCGTLTLHHSTVTGNTADMDPNIAGPFCADPLAIVEALGQKNHSH